MSFLGDRGDVIISVQCSRPYICSLCPKSCVTPVSLAEHYVSTRHEHTVQSSEPQEQNGGICLSSFLKTHLKEDNIVGLEYVTEMKKDSSYTYSCRLCKEVITNLPTIVHHIINLLHTERYIEKHFKYLLPPYRDRDRGGRKRPEYMRVLRNAAVMIVEQQGSKEIQVVLLESDGKTSEDPPLSKPESDGKTSEDPPASKSESDGKTSEDPPPSKPESDGKTSKDPPASKSESDSKTNKAFKDPPPSKLECDGKMSEASKDTQPPKSKSDGKMRVAINDPPPSKPESDGKTWGASKDPQPSKYRSYGKMRDAIMDTPPSKPESGNFSHSKSSPLPYRVSRKKYHYSKVFQKSNSNDPSSAKRSRSSPGGDQDVLPSTSTSQISKHGSSHYNKSQAITMDCTATQELEFRTNEEFFGYFANFVISDNKDVLFIRTITQNCIKALKCFLEEAERQKTGHQPEAPLEDTSRTAQEIPGTLKSCLSDSKTTLLKDNLNPPSNSIPKNEATDVFFNAIKDMNESEVVRVLQKLAATNPKFQGMDIPTVIRFLKDSGKFKKP